MKNEEIKKYQAKQMELLRETDRICKEIGIEYYMIGGTLLGAVRHGGFIPWDADIDLAMKRSDYEAFKNYWKETPSDKYFYQHYSTEANHLSPHAILKIKGTHVIKNNRVSKYQPAHDGIYLDIFPLDEPPADRKKQEKQMKKIKRIKYLTELKAGYSYTGTNFAKKAVKKAVQLLFCCVSIATLNKWLDKTMSKYQGSGSGMLVSMASHYSYWKQLMPEEIYGKPVRKEFEGESFCAPAKTEEYLTRIYKNYMELPPEDKRFSELDSIVSVDYGEGK